MNKYKKTIFFTNNSKLEFTLETNCTRKELEKFYLKILKRNKPYKEFSEEDNKTFIINPETISFIVIEERNND
jgi:hypothetical protein